MIPKDPQRRIDRALTQLFLNQPFFGVMACQLSWHSDDSIPTACTDGKSVRWNPDFIASLDDEEVLFVAAHEIHHVVKKHHLRMQSRDPLLWNMAADYQINPELKEFGVGKFLKGGLLSDKYTMDWLEEKIYNDLYQNIEKIHAEFGDVGDPGGCGEVVPFKGEAADIAAEEMRVDKAVEKAAQIAKDAGKLPGLLERYIHENKKPKVNWKIELRKFIEPVFPRHVSWDKPNRRLISQGLYIPGTVKDGTGRIAIGIDTSGSIGRDDIFQFVSEINSIFDVVKPSITQLIWFESHVWKDEIYTTEEKLKIPDKIQSGGTSFQSVWNAIEQKPRCLIMLTDMYDTFPEKPSFPVIWCATTDVKAPYGHHIRLEF